MGEKIYGTRTRYPPDRRYKKLCEAPIKVQNKAEGKMVSEYFMLEGWWWQRLVTNFYQITEFTVYRKFS